MIDRAVVDKIFDAVRIVEVVEDFVSLKKRGAHYVGCCPFHQERTPSFTVSPSKNFYKCFGCGAGGSAVNFVMEIEHLSYPDALRYLARKYGIEIIEKEQTPEERLLVDRRESLMVASAYAARVFHDNLLNNREGQAIGMSYFKERGFREGVIEKFELGYSLESREAFAKQAIKDGYKEEFLTETGLCIKNERGLFDRFAGRVMFPIHSLSGKVIAFGGRVLDVKKHPNVGKYVNSPESEIYHKSKALYGVYQAKTAISRNHKCYLVEGYTDVLSMFQAGIENVVASSGTALTQEQIQLIKRFTDNVTVLYDGDSAGIKAALRGIDMFLQEGVNVKALLLPDGDDPDSFSRKHSASEMEEYFAAHETDFIRFKTNLLLEDAQNDPIKRAELISDVVKSVSLIPDAIKRAVYLKEAAAMFEMDEQVLTATADNLLRQQAEKKFRREKENAATQAPEPAPPAVEPPAVHPKNNELEPAEREIVRLLLRYGNEILDGVVEATGEEAPSVAAFIINELRNDDMEPEQPLLRTVFDLCAEQWQATGYVDDQQFLRHSDAAVSKLAANCFASKYELSHIYEKNGALVLTEEQDLINKVPPKVLGYKLKKVSIWLDALSRDMQQASKQNDKTRYETLFERYNQLTDVKMKLAKFRKQTVG
jgi:DNA primase